ncbi:MAG: HlyC/CorC family transporter [Bryobacterales bacterium]|nr:HlyC/CorC family transporter [Acidobacteriota bacterium]MCB9385191.1 HlyC/CorC family transporter [Bryobacterales bacterium]
MEDFPISLRLVILFLLLGVNAFFAAAEVALVSVRQTRMRQLAEEGVSRAHTVLGLLAAPDRMLSATQLGVTLASLGLGWAGEDTVLRLIDPVLAYIVPAEMEQLRHIIAFVFSFVGITYFHMVLGEVVPKNLAIERSERLALLVAPPLDYFSRATGLFVSLVKGTAWHISRLLGLEMRGGQEGYTAEELKLIVSVSGREGEHAERQQRMLHRTIDFFDLTVREVMAPRQEMVALPIDASFDQVVDCIARRRHTRIPIYDGSKENVVGVVFAKEIWAFVQQMRRWQLLDRPAPKFVLQRFVRDVEFVPETKELYEMLEDFQERRRQLAMVVDEFGTVSGLVTMEDLVEQVVGEIQEEHEKMTILEPPSGPIEVDGITNVRDLEVRYEIELPYDAGFETLAGFLLSRFGHIPEVGESIEYEGRAFTVVQMERNRISRVQIETIEPAVTEES